MNVSNYKSNTYHNVDRIIIVFMIVVSAIFISLLIYLSPINFIGKNTGPIKLYYIDHLSEAHRIIIDEFNKEYKGSIEVIPIDLSFEKFSTNERKELLSRALRTESSMIDIFAVDQIWVERFSKWAKPLSVYFDKSELDQILPVALKMCYVNGELYSLPLFLDIGVLYYRKDILRNYPEYRDIEGDSYNFTWDDIFYIKEKYCKNKPVYVFQADNYEGLICNLFEIEGGLIGIVDDFYNFRLNSTGFIQTCNFVNNLIYKYKICPEEVLVLKEIPSYEYALNNDIVFFRGWLSLVKANKVLGRDTLKFKYVGFTRTIYDKGKKSFPILGGWNLMISKSCRHLKEALTFIRFLISYKSQRILKDVEGYLPVIRSIYQDTNYVNNDRVLRFAKNYLNIGISRPMDKNYTRISDIISMKTNQYFKGNLNFKEAVRQILNDIEKIRNRNIPKN